MDVKTAAKKWKITSKRVGDFLREGRIPGAYKRDGIWFLPDDAVKPGYREMSSKRLPLPVGISDFKTVCSSYYYVDKTLLIKDVLDEKAGVSLFTRPRRFGKTLNMDMLRVFFEQSNEDTAAYFEDKKIWFCGPTYRNQQGQYPVVFLSLRTLDFPTFEENLVEFKALLSKEYTRHEYLRPGLSSAEREYFDEIVRLQGDLSTISRSLFNLMDMLYEYHHQKVVLILDEYDTPIETGYIHGFFDQIIPLMRNWLSKALKDNPYLKWGFLSGIMRIAQESIFSVLNNLSVNTILDNKYAEYFGFTETEVKAILDYYGCRQLYKKVKEYYGGYLFGDQMIFSPWSIINFFKSGQLFAPYWISTGKNEVIQLLLTRHNPDAEKALVALLTGEAIPSPIDDQLTYPMINEVDGSLLSFLFFSGYLTIQHKAMINGRYYGELLIPNEEIKIVFEREIEKISTSYVKPSDLASVSLALYRGDEVQLQKSIGDILRQSVSYFDTASESFYHGLVLGFLAILDGYKVLSNREEGNGRYDLTLLPSQPHHPTIVIEIKASKKKDEDLTELAQSALSQIKAKGYAQSPALAFGLAFRGKEVEVKSEKI